jgi:hypothetical protein
MHKIISSIILSCLLFANTTFPVVEKEARNIALKKSLGVGVALAAPTWFALRKVLNNTTNLNNTESHIISALAALSLGFTSGLIMHKSVMNSRPSVKISILETFIKNLEDSFIFGLNLKNGLNEVICTKISSYYNDDDKYLTLLKDDLTNLDKNLKEKIVFLEKSKEDFFSSGFKEKYDYLVAVLSKFEFFLQEYLLRTKIFIAKDSVYKISKDFVFYFDIKNGLPDDLNLKLRQKYKNDDYMLVTLHDHLKSLLNRIDTQINSLKRHKKGFINLGLEKDFVNLNKKLNILKDHISKFYSLVENSPTFEMQLQIKSLKRELALARLQREQNRYYNNYYNSPSGYYSYRPYYIS